MLLLINYDVRLKFLERRGTIVLSELSRDHILHLYGIELAVAVLIVAELHLVDVLIEVHALGRLAEQRHLVVGEGRR